MTAKNSPGWAVELTGEAIDLDDFRDFLVRPFDPWVEESPTGNRAKLLLRSNGWGRLNDAADVSRDAERMLQVLHGAALLIVGDARPLTLGGVLKIDADGKQESTIFAASAKFETKFGRARMRAAVDPPATPLESKMQAWLRRAESDDARAELLIHLSRADNWFDIYKSMELAESLVGGIHGLKALIDGPEWKRVRQTANHHRHAPTGRYPQPERPATLSEARSFVLKTVPSVL